MKELTEEQRKEIRKRAEDSFEDIGGAWLPKKGTWKKNLSKEGFKELQRAFEDIREEREMGREEIYEDKS